MRCPRCGCKGCAECDDGGVYLCEACGLMWDRDLEELFDADELGLDPEEDDRRLYGCQ